MIPKIVGLTGGMASGKSQIRAMFENREVPCIDCDVVARNIHQDPNHPANPQLRQAFPSVIGPDGRLTSSLMRDLLGSDPTANARLQAILGPHLMQELNDWTQAQTTNFVIWESAIIIESGIKVDRLLVVDAPQYLQISRVRTRNPDWTDEQIKTMLGLQMSRMNRLRAATDVIHNNSDLENAELQVNFLYRTYTKIWSKDE